MKLKYVIYHGDCVKAMKKLNTCSIDLIFTSPPYFTMRSKINYKSYDDYLEKMRNVAKEMYRVLDIGRIAAVNVSDYTVDGTRYDLAFDWHILLREVGFTYRDTIIWEKPNELTCSGAGIFASNFLKYKLPMYYSPNRVHEFIWIFSKGKVKIPSYSKKIADMSTVSIEKGSDITRSVWHIPTRKDRDHPAVFPLELALRIVKLYSYAGEVVLDPFAGTGTTGKAAKMLNRSAVLCEINGAYVDRIKKEIGWGEMSVTEDVEYEYVCEVVE